jgi:hypothetical protein
MHSPRTHATPAVIALGLTLLACAHPASAQTYTFGGHTYFLTSTAESWTAAEAEAVADGGHLTAITSAAEETFITNTFCTAPQATAVPYWIGASDGNQTHVYTWTTGEPFSYTDWQPGEPSDTGGNEDYVAINWHFSQGVTSTQGNWNDAPLNGTTGYGGGTNGPYFGIVEVAAPEPSQWASFGLGTVALAAMTIRARRRQAAG